MGIKCDECGHMNDTSSPPFLVIAFIVFMFLAGMAWVYTRFLLSQKDGNECHRVLRRININKDYLGWDFKIYRRRCTTHFSLFDPRNDKNNTIIDNHCVQVNLDYDFDFFSVLLFQKRPFFKTKKYSEPVYNIRSTCEYNSYEFNNILFHRRGKEGDRTPSLRALGSHHRD